MTIEKIQAMLAATRALEELIHEYAKERNRQEGSADFPDYLTIEEVREDGTVEVSGELTWAYGGHETISHVLTSEDLLAAASEDPGVLEAHISAQIEQKRAEEAIRRLVIEAEKEVEREKHERAQLARLQEKYGK